MCVHKFVSHFQSAPNTQVRSEYPGVNIDPEPIQKSHWCRFWTRIATRRDPQSYLSLRASCLCLAILVHDELLYKRMRHTALPRPEHVAVKSHNTLAKAASLVVRSYEE